MKKQLKIRKAESESRKAETGELKADIRTKRKHRKAKDVCQTVTDFQKLKEILAGHGVPVHGFNALRADAYEKQVAGKSLTELDRFYKLLLGPGRSCKKIAPQCPVWGEEKKAPHFTTLTNIKNRINAERMVMERSGLDPAVKDQTGPSEQEFFDATIRVIGQELMQGKLDGKPVGENLKMFDRMLRSAVLRTRAKHLERRDELAERRFTWERQGKQIEEQPQPPMAGSELVRLSPAEVEMLGRLRLRCMTEGIYGKRSEEVRARDIQEIVDDIKVMVAEDPGMALVDGAIPEAILNAEGGVRSAESEGETPKSNLQIPAANDEARMTNDETNKAKAESEKRESGNGEEKPTVENVNASVQGSVSSVETESVKFQVSSVQADASVGTTINNTEVKLNAEGAKNAEANDEIRMTNDETKGKNPNSNSSAADASQISNLKPEQHKARRGKNWKPAWWKPGSILLAGPSTVYPKGVGKDVVTGQPFCLVTKKFVDVRSEEFRAIYDETGTANDETKEAKAESENGEEKPNSKREKGKVREAKEAAETKEEPIFYVPDMREVREILPPSEKFPKGLGICRITRQGVDMETEEFLDRHMNKVPPGKGKRVMVYYYMNDPEEAERQRQWQARPDPNRDKANGPEEWHDTPYFAPHQTPFFVQQAQMLKAKGYY